MADAALREKARTFPTRPGVYLWKSTEGEVLYVGKAQNLRARVLQYFGPQEDERKAELMQRARQVEFLAVESVKEALLLEQTLIKTHRPPYNVSLTDDKRYPYIAVTEEDWPRVVYTRDLHQRGTFFGPFPDAYKAKRVARMVNQTFRLRQCRTLPKRECLYYHLGQCSAPCIGAVDRVAYAAQVDQARTFLSGRGQELRARLQQEMEQAAHDQRFERAAELRDLTRAVDSVLERQRVDTTSREDSDALGLAAREGRWCAVILAVRDGVVVGRDSFFLNAPTGVGQPSVLAALLEQLYPHRPQVPHELLLPVPLEEAELLESVLTELQGHAVHLRVPERGPRRRFVDLAQENATLLLEQEFLLRERRGPQALEALRDALGLAEVPATLECFDVSHHAGTHTVASLVTFRDGQAHKAGYRRFKMRTAAGGDDPAALREAVLRRYTRVLAEEGADALPDLIVVDGGKPQLGAALDALRELGLESWPLVGLAKKQEEVYRPHHLHPLRLPRDSPALHLLQRARDEAHRFAIGFQGRLKEKEFLHSELDEIPGVGPERRRRLLATFGSLESLRAATPDQIARVPGIPRPLAERIHKTLESAQQPS